MNHQNFSPAAGIYWLMKLPVLPLNNIKVPVLKFLEKVPQMLAIITKSFLGRSTRKDLQNFLPVSGTYWLIKNFYPGMEKAN